MQHFRDNYPDWPVYDLAKPKQLEEFIAEVKEGRKAAGAISYDTLWRRDQLLKIKGLTLICDESSLISNEKAKRTKAILKMKKSGNLEHIVLLSGTPIDGKYERLISQAWLLDWDITKGDFYRRYIITRDIYVGAPMPVKVVVGYQNEEELKENLRSHGADFLTAEECLGSLPEQTFQELYSGTPSAYKKMDKYGICDIDGEEIIGDSILTQRLRLREICSVEFNDTRAEQIKDILETCEERVLIFYNFSSERDRLLDICEKLKKPVSEISGRRKDLEAYENEENAVALLQYAAGSMGHNLQKARITIFASLPEKSEYYEQAKCRTWRQGQTRPCIYYICRSKGTIEDDISEALARKKDLTDWLFIKEGREAV